MVKKITKQLKKPHKEQLDSLDENRTVKPKNSKSLHQSDSEKSLGSSSRNSLTKDIASQIINFELRKKNILQQINSTHQKLDTTLEFYHIIRKLGEGSYAKVYLAKSVILGLPVAIKCFDKQ